MFSLLAADGTFTSGIIIACISAVVALVSAFFSFKGKRVDAVEWLTERLREDAEETRNRLKEEGADYKEKIESLEKAVSKLEQKEMDMLAYISILEDEIKVLKQQGNGNHNEA